MHAVFHRWLQVYSVKGTAASGVSGLLTIAVHSSVCRASTCAAWSCWSESRPCSRWAGIVCSCVLPTCRVLLGIRIACSPSHRWLQALCLRSCTAPHRLTSFTLFTSRLPAAAQAQEPSCPGRDWAACHAPAGRQPCRNFRCGCHQQQQQQGRCRGRGGAAGAFGGGLSVHPEPWWVLCIGVLCCSAGLTFEHN